MNNQSSLQSNSKTRTLRLAPFFLCLICFLLPFVEVSCQGQKVAALSGLELAKGTQAEVNGEQRKIEPETAFSVAAIFAIVAALLCLLSDETGKVMPAVLGLGGFVALLMGKAKIDKDLIEQGGGTIVDTWQIGFYLACALFIVGAGIAAYQFWKEKFAPSETG